MSQLDDINAYKRIYARYCLLHNHVAAMNSFIGNVFGFDNSNVKHMALIGKVMLFNLVKDYPFVINFTLSDFTYTDKFGTISFDDEGMYKVDLNLHGIRAREDSSLYFTYKDENDSTTNDN